MKRPEYIELEVDVPLDVPVAIILGAVAFIIFSIGVYVGCLVSPSRPNLAEWIAAIAFAIGVGGLIVGAWLMRDFIVNGEQG